MSKTTPKLPGKATNEIEYAKLIPIATGGLIFLGVSRLLFFYNFFGVNILPFLDFSEIITSFLDFVFIYILTILTTWFILVKLTQSFWLNSKYILLDKGPWTLIIIAAVITLFICNIGFLFDLKSSIAKKIRIGLMIISVIGVSSFLFIIIFRRNNSRLIKDLSVLSIILVYLEGITIFLTIHNYQEVKDDKLYFGTRIVFNNEIFLKDSSHTFVSDSSDFYIGQTNKYIFIHHLKDKITSVYPISNVIQMDIKSKRDGGKLKKLLN